MPPEQQGQLCSAPFTSHISWTAALPFSSGSSPAAAASGVTTSAAGRSCPADPGQPLGLFCAPYGNPNSGITSFDNILWAWLTIFQLITQENWNEVLYDGIRATGPQAALFFIAVVVLGHYIVLNLFLAILLDNFGQDSDRQQRQGQQEAQPVLWLGADGSIVSEGSLVEAGQDSVTLPSGGSFVRAGPHGNQVGARAVPVMHGSCVGMLC